jgi:hypothetical protein
MIRGPSGQPKSDVRREEGKSLGSGVGEWGPRWLLGETGRFDRDSAATYISKASYDSTALKGLGRLRSKRARNPEFASGLSGFEPV